MAVNTGNIDVIIDNKEKEPPKCAHGPTLLFSRFDQNSGTERRFYACSAFRDRKACPFFQWADDKTKTSQEHQKCLRVPSLWPSMKHKCLRKRFLIVKRLDPSQRQLCTDCGLLLLPGEAEQHEGQGHNIVTGIKNVQLKHPTELFTPLDDNKSFAQYLFSPNTVEFVLETLTAQKATHVLCIGCPRIHEAIQCIKDGSMDSLLMDLDHRYLQMYSPKKLLQYNMLNHHFFAGETDRSTYEGFLGAGKVAVVIDPPFGIMVEALSHTLDRLQQDWRAHADLPGTGEETKLPVFWFFPYFMEQRVIDTCPTLAMLDYKVDYVNHALFRGEGGRKKGSPVRIFTNIPAKQITLPADAGYWYCGDCERFSSLENKHCDLCKACTTKDGCTYRHCDRCGRCVKPSRVHCDTCNVCDIPTHSCSKPRSIGCHICGKVGHKRRECPDKGGPHEQSLGRNGKRKMRTDMKANSRDRKKRRETKMDSVQ